MSNNLSDGSDVQIISVIKKIADIKSICLFSTFVFATDIIVGEYYGIILYDTTWDKIVETIPFGALLFHIIFIAFIIKISLITKLVFYKVFLLLKPSDIDNYREEMDYSVLELDLLEYLHRNQHQILKNDYEEDRKNKQEANLIYERIYTCCFIASFYSVFDNNSVNFFINSFGGNSIFLLIITFLVMITMAFTEEDFSKVKIGPFAKVINKEKIEKYNKKQEEKRQSTKKSWLQVVML